MHSYFVNQKRVTKQEWKEAYLRESTASVVLRTASMGCRTHIMREQEDDAPPISCERLDFFKNEFKKNLKFNSKNNKNG
jgi:hypothetical protein